MSTLYNNTLITAQDAQNVIIQAVDTRIIISSVTPSTFSDGTTGIVIDGQRFQNTGNTYLDASATADPTVTGVQQTETARSSSQITFTCVQGGLSAGTVYLYVTNSSGDWGTPYACTLTAAGAVGSSDGVAVVSGVSSSTANGVASSDGVAVVSGVSSSTANGVASSSGIAVGSGVGASTFSAVGSSSGTATVAGVGSSTLPGEAVGTSSGASTVASVGSSLSSAVGSSAGTSTALAVGTYIGPVYAAGSSSGTSNVVGIALNAGKATGGGIGRRKKHRQFANIDGKLIEVANYKEAEKLIAHFNKGKATPKPKKRRITFGRGPYVAVYDSFSMPQKQIKSQLKSFYDDEELLLLLLMAA